MAETIHDIISGGVIAASSADLDIVIQSTGSYHNVYVSNGDGTYRCTDCQPRSPDFYKINVSALVDEAEAYLEQLVNPKECSECGEDDEELFEIDHQLYCKSCAEEQYYRCARCEEWFETLDENSGLCEDCNEEGAEQ